MRVFIAAIILIFSFQSPSQADDIRDFQIEGMSIGDSALDYFKENEIKSRTKGTYPSDDKFYQIGFGNKFDNYELVQFHLKKNDNRFIMYGLTGKTKMEFNKCLEQKKIVIKEIKEILTKVSEKNYKSDYRKKYGKSFSEVTDLNVEGGSIRIYCDNWEEKYTEMNGWDDSFNVSASSEELLLWLDNEAYK